MTTTDNLNSNFNHNPNIQNQQNNNFNENFSHNFNNNNSNLNVHQSPINDQNNNNINNPYYAMQSENNINKSLVKDFNHREDGQWEKNNEDLSSSYSNDFINNGGNKEMRLGFIRKVYGVLSAQLIFTACLSSIGFIDSVREYYLHNMWLFWFSFVLSIIVIIPLVCCKNVARKVPINYILLFGFTACESIMLSYAFAAINDWKLVLTAAGITVAVTIALTAYACTTKTDFTLLGGMLFVLVTIMFFMGLFYFIFGQFLRIFYCCLGVLVYSIYLIFDTQLVMGKFGNEFSIDDYIIAALNIYIDIIQLFLYILSILGNSRR